MPESPKPEAEDKNASWNLKLAEIAIQAIVGGSFGTFVTLLSSSDLPKLALGAAIGGVGAPIVLAVTEPFSKRLKRGAGYVSETTAAGAEEAVQAWWTSLSGSEQKYLKALETHCYSLEGEGFQRYLPSLALEDVFIPLHLDTDHGNVYGEKASSLSIWDFLPKAEVSLPVVLPDRRLAVVAKPGYGKTTLTRYLALNYSRPTYKDAGAARLLPVLLRFRRIQAWVQSEMQPKLETLIVQWVREVLPQCGELAVTEAWLRQQLQDGKCLVMLDGLDEVPEDRRELLSRWANRQIQEYDSVFILTSRPHGYNADWFPGVRQLGILDFTNEQKRTFLDKWYHVTLWEQKWKGFWQNSLTKPAGQRLTEEQAKAQRDTEAKQAAADLYRQIVGNVAINQQLAVNPLLLTIIAVTHQAFAVLPERREDLYGEMFNILLEKRPLCRNMPLSLTKAVRSQPVLQGLAMQLTLADQTRFSRRQGAGWIQEALQAALAEQGGESGCTPAQFFQEIEEIAGLLTGGEGDAYEFAHKTFQEYLTALEIQASGQENLLLERLRKGEWKPVNDWREIFSFYAAKVGADWLVEAVSRMPSGEFRQQCLALLHRLVKEERSRLSPAASQTFETLLATTQFTGTTAAKITLEQRFQQMLRLDERTEMTTSPLTWGEYLQFLEAQNTGQFHSTAQVQTISPEQFNQPAVGLTDADRRWFCAWLPTQTSLQAEGVLFDYELPKAEHYQAAGIAEDGQFYILRRQLDPKYAQLMNYLASASWKEADEETYRLMITEVGKKEGQWFDPEDLLKFPCEPLRAIDGLWVKYSNGRFGFSVQKTIYLSKEIGGIADGRYHEEAWTKFCHAIGWQQDGNSELLRVLIFNTSAPQGHLPRWVVLGGLGGGGWGFGVGWCGVVLFSRIQTCKV